MSIRLALMVWVLLAMVVTGRQQFTVAPRLYVFDLAGDGRAFTSASDGVWFDLDGDGRRERTAWTRQDSDDSFLFLDGNGNGAVDSARELAGSAWVTSDGQGVPEAGVSLVLMQGFSIKTTPGEPTPPGISVINQDDEVYSRLRVWTDRNHNGVSERAELRTLRNAGVLEVDLLFRKYPSPVRDASGNETQLEGTFRIRDSSRGVERRMGLVRFATG